MKYPEYPTQVEIAKGQIRKYTEWWLKEHKPLEVEIKYPSGRVYDLLLLNDKLVLLSLKHNFLFKLDPVSSWNGGTIPEHHCVMMDHLFKFEDYLYIDKNPVRFLEELTKKAFDHTEWFYIYIDGQLVHKTISGRKCTKMRNQYIKERKDGGVKFKHLKVIDPEKKETDFLFNRS